MNRRLRAPHWQSVCAGQQVFRKNCVNSSINTQQKGARRRLSNCEAASCDKFERNDQRFENWNDLRALARPYFLRSTTRESRVRKPPFFSTVRRSGSKLVNALEIPWRTAPAWPERPPPVTVQITSYWPARAAAISGC